MIELVTAVQAKNLDDFERVLKQHSAPIVGVHPLITRLLDRL